MPSRVEHERIAIELKKWLHSQNRYKRIKDLQAPTGIPYESLKDYFQGRSLPSGERLQRLVAVTALPSLIALSSSRSGQASKTSTSSSEEMAQAVFATVHRLLNELNF